MVEFNTLIDLVVNAKMAFQAGSGEDPSINNLVNELSSTNRGGSIVGECWNVNITSIKNEALRASTPNYNPENSLVIRELDSFLEKLNEAKGRVEAIRDTWKRDPEILRGFSERFRRGL